MDEFWILIFVSFFAINSLGKAESVDLFDEIFGEGWWNKDKAVEWHKLTLEQNALHQIDRQNTQIGQIEPKSTDQLGQIEPNSTDQNAPLTESDHFGQIEPNSTDQNAPLTESNHSGNAKNGEEQNEITSNENNAENERKCKIIDKFHAIKEEFKQKRKYSKKEITKIEEKIAKHLKVNRKKIYKWKKELGRTQKEFYEKEERKHLVEKFDQRKVELKRDGFKDSYHHEIDETVAKELGLSVRTFYRWKRKLGQFKQNKYSLSEQKELMKRYYEIKDQSPKMSVGDIAKMLKIGTVTLYKWKKQINQQQFHPNSVDGHSVEENAGNLSSRTE